MSTEQEWAGDRPGRKTYGSIYGLGGVWIGTYRVTTYDNRGRRLKSSVQTGRGFTSPMSNPENRLRAQTRAENSAIWQHINEKHSGSRLKTGLYKRAKVELLRWKIQYLYSEQTQTFKRENIDHKYFMVLRDRKRGVLVKEPWSSQPQAVQEP